MIQYAIRHTATGLYMPQTANNRGYSNWAPKNDAIAAIAGNRCGVDNAVPNSIRLFPTHRAAKNAITAWLKGAAHNAYRDDPEGDFLLEYKDMGRKAGDVEVVEMVLTEAGKVLDPHTLAAAEFFKIDPAAVTPEQREVGKRRNFASMYHLPPDDGGGKFRAVVNTPDLTTVTFRVDKKLGQLLADIPYDKIEAVLSLAAMRSSYRYAYDDMHIGLFKDGDKALTTRVIPNPYPQVEGGLEKWYRYAKQVCEALNAKETT